MLDKTNTPSIRVNIVVPIILFLMVFSLVIDNSFKIIQPDLVKYFGVDASTASWQVTLAGLIVGIGAIVYAALSDSISIRKLLCAGIVLICIGSSIGYLVHDNYVLVVAARIIQSTGLGATETLYLVTVAKYLSSEDQKKFMGFSTSAFQTSLVIGMLTGGFIATYMVWYNLFLVPLFTILLLPFIWKYLPEDKGTGNSVDIIGMLLVGIVSTTILVLVSNFSWLILGLFILSVLLFFLYISKAKGAFIDSSFFKNKLYVFVLAIVFIIYSIQAAYGLSTFAFMLTSIYHVELDTVSTMFIPACVGAAIVGSLSGKIGEHFSSKQCIYASLLIIIGSVFISIFLIGQPIIVFAIALIAFNASFALMYAPLIDTSLKKVPVEKSGTALGFYNLCINIAISIGFTYSAALIDRDFISLGIHNEMVQDHYSGVLLVIGLIGIVGLAIYHFLVVPITKKL